MQKTVRKLKDKGFYDFFQDLPFWPILVIGQGATVKSPLTSTYRDGEDPVEWRRTSDFSAPHKLVVDGEGRRSVPINEASKSYIRRA